MSEFNRCMSKLLVHEGGKVDNPKDPGGRTNQGVTQRTYDAYRRRKGLPTRDVYLMTDAERDEIYRSQYWDAVKGDELPPGVSYVLFDGAVNSGVGQSVKWLQRALGPVYSGKVDGIIGDQTIQAVNAVNDHDALIGRILDRRMAFLKALRTWKTFGKGWTRRVDDVRAVGQAWAMGSVGPDIAYIPGGEAKARIEDAKAAPPRAPGDVAAGGGTIGTVLTQATDQLTPLSSIEFVGKAIAVLTIAGVVVAVAGIGYRMWAKRKADELADALDLKAVA